MKPRRPPALRLLALLALFALLALACTPSSSEAPATKREVPPAAAANEPAPTAKATAAAAAPSPGPLELSTEDGALRVFPVHHGTLRLEWNGKVVWVDPYSEGNLEGPDADLVLVTDVHKDHLDPKGLEAVKKPGSVVVGPPAVAKELQGAVALANGEKKELLGIGITAVPMYNLERGPEAGKVFHEKGRGNGYLLEIGGKRVYVAGDTECTPEMKAQKNVDLAFVPMNLPYTMPPSEAAACVKAFRPAVVVPYHHRGSDLGEFKRALEGEEGIDVRILDFYRSAGAGKGG